VQLQKFQTKRLNSNLAKVADYLIEIDQDHLYDAFCMENKLVYSDWIFYERDPHEISKRPYIAVDINDKSTFLKSFIALSRYIDIIFDLNGVKMYKDELKELIQQCHSYQVIYYLENWRTNIETNYHIQIKPVLGGPWVKGRYRNDLYDGTDTLVSGYSSESFMQYFWVQLHDIDDDDCEEQDPECAKMNHCGWEYFNPIFPIMWNWENNRLEFQFMFMEMFDFEYVLLSMDPVTDEVDEEIKIGLHEFDTNPLVFLPSASTWFKYSKNDNDILMLN